MKPDVQGFDTSCFSGEYVTNDISQKYLKAIESKRSDDAIRDSEQLRKQIEINDPSISVN